MAATLKLQIISREAIKPSKPTAPQCKSHRLSLLDQHVASLYVPILLFYQKPTSFYDITTLSNHLKNSLSETLTHYYPFAGKIIQDNTIDCNDDGVLFIDARLKSQLSDVLNKQPEPSLLDRLFPDGLQWKSSKGGHLVAIQLSFFDCGGFSIGACFSHKIADACTICTFLGDWATLANQHQYQSAVDLIPVCPALFSGVSAFSPDEEFVVSEVEPTYKSNLVTQRFVFNFNTISKLLATVSNNSTRFEVVSSFLYKSIVRSQQERKNMYAFIQLMNLRPRMSPPLPKNSIGNIFLYFPLIIREDDDVTNIATLVEKMRGEREKFCDFIRNAQRKDWVSMLARSKRKNEENPKKDNGQVYLCTNSSWCGFPMYQIDFGWGKPIWVITTGGFYMDNIFLMDTKDGEGIEAWVTIDEKVMADLQGDKELLRFATSNP